jgi:DeoR family galactitol utilization operon repressor
MHATVQDIASAAGVSEATVVRFCRRYGFDGVPDFRIALAQALAEAKLAPGGAFIEPRLSDRALVNRQHKQAIARFALRFVADDRSIIVDSGSTTELFAHQLVAAGPLVVMTTGLNVINALMRVPQHTLMIAGGRVRVEGMSIVGRMIETTLSTMTFDTAYIGANAVDPERGLSAFLEEEAYLSSALAKAARRIVVLADSSKFRVPALHHFLDLAKIHAIVTDDGLADDAAARIEAQGVAVHRVPSDKEPP